MTGGGSQFTSSSSLSVGGSGNGTLNINSGGTVVTASGSLGSQGGSGNVMIDGTSSSWTITSGLLLGLSSGHGDVTIQNGALLSSEIAYINQSSNSSSTVTVSGSQSTWNNSSDMHIGSGSGQGILNINQGGIVTTGGDTTVGRSSIPYGQINFNNGSLNTGGLLTGVNDLTGVGTINAHGLVTDVDLAFDQNSGAQKQIVLSNGSNQNVTVNVDANNSGSLGAGYRGAGTLSIAGGIALESRRGFLGYHPGSSGSATVDGASSKWKISNDLNVGYSGAGALAIKNGGSVEVGQTTYTNASDSSSISFDNGTLSTTSLLAGVIQLNGTGTINTHGVVSDVDLVFDQTHPFQQQLIVNSQPNQNLTVNLDVDGTGAMGAGYRGQGTLTIADGVTLNSPAGYLGYGLGSNGTATVSGTGSNWAISGDLYVGYGGMGNLTISDGASASNSFALVANGVVTVTGNGSNWTSQSNWVIAGINGGSGELIVSDGGTVTSTSLFSPFSGIGTRSAGTGKVTIDGLGSSWTNNGLLTIGGSTGTGRLVVSGGGKVTTSGVTIGTGFSAAVGTATITGPGSTWTNNGALTVGGNSSSGILTVSNGATLISTSGSLNGLPVGVSTATITDVGSTWSTTGSITVGDTNAGSMTISSGGVVSSKTGGIGKFFVVTSSVNIADQGSAWKITNGLAVGGYFASSSSTTPTSGGPGTLAISSSASVQAAGDTMIFSQGRINLQGGSLTTNSIKFQSGGVFNWTSGTLHVGTYNGNLTNSAGILSPGQSPGKTTITGTYAQQSAASLQIEIGGLTSTTQYDTVSVTGSTTLGGALQLLLINSFLPNADDTFTVLASTGSLSGTFNNVANGQRLLTSDGLGTFLVNYGTGSLFNTKQVVLSGFAIAGDYNIDGSVDAADYVVWRRNDGTQAGYSLWRSHLGQTVGSSSGVGPNTAVPEPATLIMLVIGTLVTFASRLRRCNSI